MPYYYGYSSRYRLDPRQRSDDKVSDRTGSMSELFGSLSGIRLSRSEINLKVKIPECE